MPHNLPLQLTSFIGRGREQAEVRDLLATTRLLTLTGPGGAGKTRLALRVAVNLVDDYADGVWFVDLAPLADSALVPQAVASALGIPERPGAPLLATLCDALRSKQALLLLDNCEHLLPGATELADALLRACPHLQIFATSREALNIAGETVWRVPSLTLPGDGGRDGLKVGARFIAPDRPLESEAVQLFADRARAVLPGFALSDRSSTTVAGICRRLDGMPLAIELAAARIRVLSPEQIDARLDDRFRLLTGGSRTAATRQQTLEATIDWSYALLSEQEQRLFGRLSVFAGGWTLEAAEQVCTGEPVERSGVLDLLAALVDKSLVLAEPSADGTMRYRLLETLRRYGQERLRECGEAEAVARRHATFCIELAEQAEAAFNGPGEFEALHRLDAEHENLRSALGSLIASGDVENGQRLGGSVSRFWLFRSYLTEGRVWLNQLLAPSGGEARTAPRAKCLFGAATLAIFQGDAAAAQAQAEEALGLWRKLGNDKQAAASIYQLGLLAKIRGDDAAAGALLEDAAEASRRAGNHAYEALSLMWLAETATLQGDFATARARAEAAWRRATEVGSLNIVESTLMVLADACYEQGDDAAARAFAEESVARSRDQFLGSFWLALPLLSLGQIAAAQRDFARAQSALAEATRLSREIGDKSGVAAGLRAFAYLECLRGQPERAASLAASGEALRRHIGGTMKLVSRRVQGQLESIAGSLDPDVYQAAQLKGQSMSLDEAADYALSVGGGGDEPGEAAHKPLDALTPREREVATLVAEGLSNRQIADRLVLTEKTAANHVARAFDKLGIHSRGQLAARAVELGLRDPASLS